MAQPVHPSLELPSKHSSFSLLGLADETLSFLSQKVLAHRPCTSTLQHLQSWASYRTASVTQLSTSVALLTYHQ